MNKSTVAIVKCNNYDEELVYQKVKEGIKLIGGLDSIIKKDEKIVVKPNLLKNVDPAKAATTHPSVFGAFLRCLKEEGYTNVTYGDSSAIGTMVKTEKVAETCGLKKEADKYGYKIGNFEEGVSVKYKEGKTAKKFVIAKGILDGDAVISISKMKTHALENITGAIKNQYGCIYANNKALFHAKYPNSNIFARMLIDLNKFVHPRLFIMDGIIAMEGNGPSSGDPVLMNVLLFSKDPVALDAVFAQLVDLKPEYVPTCFYGEKMGLGTYENIQIIDESGKLTKEEAFKKYGNPNFVVNRKKQSFWDLKTMLMPTRKPKHKPVVDLDKCIACGMCQNACPVDGKAVHSGNGQKATYDYSKCIRCYCCQELCPAKAIKRLDS